MLLGREPERGAIDRALGRARAGASATLAVVGEPGIGKTALLDYAVERSQGMQVLRARGIESEADIPFASLLELIRPALPLLQQIPAPQVAALETALALRPGLSQERFAIGAATLSLLADYAERAPVLAVIDDAQWLDESSAQALLFAVRRLVADPIAVLIAVRDGEPSLLDGADLPTLRLHGLTLPDAGALLNGAGPEATARLHRATAGNPLALLELAAEADSVALAPEGAPLLVGTRITRSFVRRVSGLDERARSALALAATSDSGDLALLGRAAERLGLDLSALAAAEQAGMVSLGEGSVEFRHPLARSAVYADASPQRRREAHRALAAALPDRDVERRAWHLAASAAGADDVASAALEQAAVRSRERSAYASAAVAFERAARLAVDRRRRARLLSAAAEASWNAGWADRAAALLDEARESTDDPVRAVELDHLSGHIATQRGPIMNGHAVLTAAAERAASDQAVLMLADAALACLYAGDPAEMLVVAARARARLAEDPSVRSRFLVAVALGMARVMGGDAAAGAASMHEAVRLAESSQAFGGDLRLLPWLAMAPIFLREEGAGRALLERSLSAARERAALGTLPLVLNLIARDQATTDHWAVAEATYREAIDLARETDQRTQLALGLAGVAWLLARRGRAEECRVAAAEALALCRTLGARLLEVWAAAALGELALALGDADDAAEHFERHLRLTDQLGITDADLSPAPELVDAYVRLGRIDAAARTAEGFSAVAEAKGQPWSLARAWRCRGVLAEGAASVTAFEEALRQHARTPDSFETARTRLAYGESLRRARRRVLARPQLRDAVEAFERLDARPWADRARTELIATGETLRRRDPSAIDELTSQELQIALLLAGGKTTRETAAALFLSPKTIEYHLRHVYLKLGVHSRDELARALDAAALR